VDQDGRLVQERAISPRLQIAWRPTARLPWTLTAAYGRNVPALFGRAIDASFWARPSERVFLYDGPAINLDGPPVEARDAIARALDWFTLAGGTTRLPLMATEPGVTVTSARPIGAPRVDEWSFGVSRNLGEDGHARADLSWRSYGRIPGRVVVPGAGVFAPSTGHVLDAGELAHDDRLTRRYASLTLSADYRFGHWADVGARYTLASLRGNADNATLRGDWPASAALSYREYVDPAWHLPVGALPDDARHRMRAWLRSELYASESMGTLVLAMLVSRESGRPYGASGLVAVEPHVSNPGYLQPPIAVRYFFTERDAFRTQGIMRADIGLTYRRRLPRTVHGEWFAQFDVLNLANRRRPFDAERLAVTRTALTDPSLLPFNPFTDTPVEGVHWTFDDANVRRDTARESVARTLARAIRVVMGIRF
jgi:hypothetical protein